MARETEPRVLSRSRWLRALAAPGVALRMSSTCGCAQVGRHWRYVNRVLPEHLLYLVVRERVSAHVGGRTRRLEPGQLLWLAPGVRHTFELADRTRPVTVYHVRFRLIEQGRDLRLRPAMMLRPNAWMMRDLFDQLLAELQMRVPHRDAMLRSVMSAICVHVFRGAGGRHAGGPTLSQHQSGQLLRYVQAHPWPTPADLAAAVRLSPAYFTRVFRRTFGVSPRTWLVRQRIAAARQRLAESSLGVTEVADELGYRDVHFFSRQFKQVTGMSPLAYRRRA